MLKLKIGLWDITDDTLLLTVSADLTQVHAWQMFLDGLEGLPGVQYTRVDRYSTKLKFASWVTLSEVLAEAISAEFHSGVIVEQLFAQTTIPISSVSYTDNGQNTYRTWESNDGR